MGVDATFFVLANYRNYGDGVGYVCASFQLERDRELWPELDDLPAEKKWAQIQLPQGAWCNYEGEVPDGFEDYENGYLQEDSYGVSFTSFKGKFLGDIKQKYSDLNNSICRFIAENYMENDVVIFWH